jgi:dihydrofolate synthase/folylpolyglutamate synthase
MSDRKLEQWLQRLEKLHPSEIELGLDRVASVAAVMQLLEPGCPVVTIAGTNGKGTTAAVLEALLLRSGLCVGCFTSPHFLRFNERIKVAGEEAADRDIEAAFAAIDESRGGISLTYFEFATLAALWVFRQRGVDVMILEVGLGGRLDATNIIEPTIAVVTSIALDHQEWLGDTREQIAVEKAGILRRGTPAVIADPDPPPALLDCAADLGAHPVFCFGRDFGMGGDGMIEVLDTDGSTVRLQAPTVTDLLPQNVSAAVQVACLLDELPGQLECRETLSGITVPGRRETVTIGEVECVLDVAHNPASARALGAFLTATPCEGRTLAVFSAMADKDIDAIIAPLAGMVDAWFLADQPGNPRAAPAADLAAALRSLGETMISVSKNLRQAFARARQLVSGGDRLVVFGSFSTVAALLPVLEQDRQKALAGVTR